MADTQLTQSGAQVQADLNLVENLQDAFSPSSSYAVGDLVIYNTKIYKCISAVSPGEWNSTKWTQIKLSNLQEKLISGSNIKTVNDASILGSGNIETTRLYRHTCSFIDASSNFQKLIIISVTSASYESKDIISDLRNILSVISIGSTEDKHLMGALNLTSNNNLYTLTFDCSIAEETITLVSGQASPTFTVLEDIVVQL